MDQLIAIFSIKWLTAQMERLDVHDHYDRRRKNLLQGLGIRPADRFQPRLAAVGGRLGRPDDLLPSPRLPGDRPRPARPRPVRPARHRQRHGPMGCRPRGPDGTPRPARRDPYWALDRWR